MMKLRYLLLFLLLNPSVRAQYLITPLISGLNHPIAFDQTPDGRLFITLQSGIIQSYDTSGSFIQTMYDISDSTFDYGECGMLGICVDPQFALNHYLYVYYNHFDSNATATQARMRVLRLTESGNIASGPVMLLDIPQLGNNHLGGNIHFSHTSMNDLYVTIGENTIQPNAQLTNNPYGKILRIHSDGTIPSDNPFYDDGDPAIGFDDRIWVYGLRNSFDFTFSPLTDSLYATENGPTQDDEVNMIHAGKNYGWPTFTGYSNNPSYQDPVFTWPSPTVAPTGILFYHDTTFPQFNNHLLVNVFNNGYVYDLALGNSPFYDTIIGSSIVFNFGSGFANFLTSIQQGPDGCIYILHGGSTGILYRIRPDISGVNETQKNPFTVSPVPTDNQLWLYGTLSPGATEITTSLYDVWGRKLFSELQILKMTSEFTKAFSLASFPSGIYILQTELKRDSRSQTYNNRLVITH